MRNSKVILAKDINLDNSYANVLNYSVNDMLSLLTSQSHVTYQADNYSFVRENDNQINIQAPYDVCLNSNYLAFQNTRYSNKWFFAFIKDVKYNSEKSTVITFEVDVFSTWFRDLSLKPVFVEREHVNDDTAGNYTLPEGLELGEFVQAGTPVDLNNYSTGTYICIQASELIEEVDYGDVDDKTINGIYQGCYFMIFTEPIYASNMIEIYDRVGKGEAIVSVFLVPKAFAIGNVTTAIAGSYTDSEGTINFTFLTPNSYNTYNTLVADATFNRNTTIDGYTPKNKKLLTYPYNYFNLSNNAGVSVPFRYEDFSSGTPHFKIVGDLSPGCSIKCVPLNYKKVTDTSTSMNSFDYGIVAGKFPVCSWNSDAYTNWLTQNGVNNTISTITSVGQIALGMGLMATGVGAIAGAGAMLGFGTIAGASTIGSGVNGILDQVKQRTQASFMPDQAKGNTNCGDITYSANKNVFTCYKMCVRSEIAHVIDDYFTRFGYQINRVKTPNVSGRTYWNYVKIGTGEDIGNGTIPNKFKDTLNQIFRNGTTIWHSHDNIGNFALNNTIVS